MWAFALGKMLTDPIWWFYLFWLPKFLASEHGIRGRALIPYLTTVYLIADAGSIFGGAILVAHEIHGAEAKADLPDPAILLIVITTVLAVGFGALGGWLRERATRRVG